MENQQLIIAGGALVVGVLLAVAISGARFDGQLADALERAEGASATALEQTTEDLNARIAELESELEAGTEAASSAIDERVAALRENVAQRIDAVSQAAEDSANDLQSTIGDLFARLETAQQAVTGTDDLSDRMETLGPLSVGQTAIFMEGAARVFVAALDRDDGAARLVANGTTISLGIGETASIDIDGTSCEVGLAALDEAGATIGSDCGSGSGETAAADVPPAPEDGYSVGNTVLLADGGLRVFVSGLASDRSSARLAINGTDLKTIAAGSTISVETADGSCDLTVTGVGDNTVGLSADCG